MPLLWDILSEKDKEKLKLLRDKLQKLEQVEKQEEKTCRDGVRER